MNARSRINPAHSRWWDNWLTRLKPCHDKNRHGLRHPVWLKSRSALWRCVGSNSHLPSCGISKIRNSVTSYWLRAGSIVPVWLGAFAVACNLLSCTQECEDDGAYYIMAAISARAFRGELARRPTNCTVDAGPRCDEVHSIALQSQDGTKGH